ncbi:MAG: uncharacterized protein A8A55_2131, partial [Amphiamblys sp. WSBS2006]
EITPNTTVSDIEMELLDVKRREILRDMGRRGVHVAPEHLEETTERRRLEQSENSGTIQPRLVDSLVLTIAELSAGPVLLGPETTVYLPDMWLSDALFFRLLEKTKVVLGGTVSLFKHLGRKKCIREGMDVEYEEEVRLSPAIKNNTLFRENVAGLPDKSIYLWGVKSLTLKDHTVNLLPKLKLHEDNETEEFSLDAELGEHVSSILGAKDSSIWLGKVRKLRLERHAINLLPKLKLHEDNVLEEEFWLDAELGEHVSSILGTGNGTIWLGKVKSLKLNHFAVNLLPLLKLHEDSVMEEFGLDAKKEEYVSSILSAGDRSIWLGRVKSLKLYNHAVNTLPKLKLHEDNVMEYFWLHARQREHISEIFVKKDNSIWLGKVKKLELWNYAINLLPKLWLHEDNVMEYFWLSGWPKREYISEILVKKDSSIWLGKVKSLRLEWYAVNILPKLWLHEDNVMDSLVIVGVNRYMLQEDYWILNKIKTARSALEVLFPSKTGDSQTEQLLGPGMDGGCCGWKIKQIKMDRSTVYALRGIRSDKSGVLDRFELTNPKEEEVKKIFRSDERVYLGKIKQNGLIVPPSIKEALIYTLVDEEDVDSDCRAEELSKEALLQSPSEADHPFIKKRHL